MKTIVQPVQPQPVLVDGRRWIWGRTEPITDMCRTQPDGKRGNAIVSWVADEDIDDCGLMHDYCPIPRSAKAKVSMAHDGERWVWIVRMSDRDAKKIAEKGAEL